MSFHNQPILPAIRNMKQFDEFLNSSFSYGVILDIHLGQLKGVIREAQKHGKKMMVHVDLIQGIKHDEYGAEFICQDIKPAGIISTRSNVIAKAKQKKIYAIQRLFLLDTSAMEKAWSLSASISLTSLKCCRASCRHLFRKLKRKQVSLSLREVSSAQNKM